MNMELRLLNACQRFGEGAGGGGFKFVERESAEIQGWCRRQAGVGIDSIVKFLQQEKEERGNGPDEGAGENAFSSAFEDSKQSLLEFVLEKRQSLGSNKKLLCLIVDGERRAELFSGLSSTLDKRIEGGRLFCLNPSNSSIRVVMRLLHELNQAMAELSEAESLYCKQIEVQEGRLFIGDSELSLLRARYEELLQSLGVTPGLFSLARQKAASEKEGCVQFLRKNQEVLHATSRSELAEADIVIADPYDFLRFSELHDYLKDFEIVLLDGAGALSLRYVQIFMQMAQGSFVYRLGEALEQHVQGDNSKLFYDAQFASHLDWLTGLVKEPTLLEEARGTSELYNEKNFWERFLKDLEQAQEEVIIVSPFCFPYRMKILAGTFKALVERGVRLRVFISDRPRNPNSDEMVKNELQALGIETRIIAGLHAKAAFIDGKIAWEGSMNILSHKESLENMRRFQGEAMVRESLSRLDFGV